MKNSLLKSDEVDFGNEKWFPRPKAVYHSFAAACSCYDPFLLKTGRPLLFHCVAHERYDGAIAAIRFGTHAHGVVEGGVVGKHD